MLAPGEVMTPAPDTSMDEAPSQRRAVARVLIVDDERAVCKLLATVLSQDGFDCRTELSGEAALPLLAPGSLDAVISDMNMPGMTGMELLAETRRRCPFVAFLVATGVDDVKAGIQAMKAGADDYLVKPLQAEVVIASLQRALEKKRLERELERYRVHLEEMVAERTQQITAALNLVEHSYEETLESLGAAIDLRDNATGGHSRRVCRYSLEIGKAMELPDVQLRSLAMGAYLHDIGKLALPDGILLKPGPLTPEERELMQKHVRVGHDLVKKISFLAGAAELILTHHERFDGSGYPSGLRGEQIPVGGRIFAIADTLDAVTSERPYQRARTFEAGLRIIRGGSGRLFDPQVVSAFFSIPEETWCAIARHQHQVTSFPSWLRADTVARPLASISFSPRK